MMKRQIQALHVLSRMLTLELRASVQLLRLRLAKVNVKKNGFTLVELIITILVIGVLAVTAAPRFLGNDTEEAIALRDRTLQFVRNMLCENIRVNYCTACWA